MVAAKSKPLVCSEFRWDAGVLQGRLAFDFRKGRDKDMRVRKLESLELNNKKVLVRLDLNVPIRDGQIKDDTRIRAALPSLRYILERTNKVAVMSHLGRPKGVVDEALSLEPVAARLAELLGKEVLFVKDYTEEPVTQLMGQLKPNQLVVLENLVFIQVKRKMIPVFTSVSPRL